MRAIKKTQKKQFVTFLSGLLLLASTALAIGERSSRDAAQGQAESHQKHQPRWLYVINSKQAELKHIKGNLYTLTLPHPHTVKKVLAFTDRPYRKAVRLSIEQYRQSVSAGQNSFNKNVPNLALTWSNKSISPEAFIVIGHQQVNDSFVLSLKWIPDSKHAAYPKNKVGAASLFIDDAIILSGVLTQDQCYGAGGSWSSSTESCIIGSDTSMASSITCVDQAGSVIEC